MTAATERTTISVEEFEELARNSAELLRLEFIDGRVGVKAMADGDHLQIVMWLIKLFVRLRPELSLFSEMQLKVETYRDGRAWADAALAPDEAFAGQGGDWFDPSPVLMAVEVTSFDHDTDRRDRHDKPRAYAESDIPVFLLIDRDSCETVVYSIPVDGRYTKVTKHPFGEHVRLPAPVDATIDTEPLKNWVR